MSRCLPIVIVVALVLPARASAAEPNAVERIPLLMHSADVARRSEGDFVQLRDGRIVFIYTKFTGGRGDGADAHLASRESRDGGHTWTTDDVDLDLNDG